jgi:long-chain fatty acid transport protein
MQRLSAIHVLGILVCVLGMSQGASAQGFAVYEQSGCAMGRGVTGVAAPCPDGSAVFFNPAGLSFEKRQIGLGASFIGPFGDFTDNTTGQVSELNEKYYPVPNFFFSSPIGKRLALGIGVFAPYGLTTDWPTSSQGRFLGYKSVVKGVFVQPTLSFKVNDNVSIGGGLDITHLSVELRQRVDLYTQPLGATGLTFGQLNLVCPAGVCGTVNPGTDFADVRLEGSTYSVGFHLGVMARLNDKVSLGARYLHGQSVDVTEGMIETAQISVPNVRVPVPGVGLVPVDTVMASQAFAAGKPLQTGQDAQSNLPLPAQFVVGTAIKVAPKVTLFADYQFTNWSAFDVLPIDGEFLQSEIVENYGDTHGIRLGAEFEVNERWTLRAGFDGHNAAAPDESVTPNLPEGKRTEFMGGVGVRLTPVMRLDLSYMYLRQPERAGRTQPGANNGVYNFNANLFGAMLAFEF